MTCLTIYFCNYLSRYILVKFLETIRCKPATSLSQKYLL
uniref:Uncharacterized protein n=1 Tax=Arundo donax TaxID=35708 RepID=A0A0A9HEY8_ARUDO